MKIVILSDSPTMNSGFARTTKMWASLLTQLQHNVICFGIGAWGNFHDINAYNYEIWQAGILSDEHKNKFYELLNFAKPELIIINYELIRTLNWIIFLKKNGIKIKIVTYLIVDGLPIFPQILAPLNLVDLIITTTKVVKEFIQKHTNTKVVSFPHLVDQTFVSLPNIKMQKNRYLNNTPLIGVFAANNPRKQISSVLQAFKNLRLKNVPCNLYIHTDYINTTSHGGDNLNYLVKYYALEKDVFITESTSNLQADLVNQNFLSNLSVEEKINCCDVIVVASKFGGFEYSIIEAQACKVPVCATNDNGVMKEVGGNGVHLLEPCMYEFTNYGARSFLIRPSIIAEAILKIFNNENYTKELIESGSENVKRFSIENNFTYFRQIIDSINC